jgi:hypothetical protein
MIHIVFQAADADVLRAAMELEPAIAGPVLQIRDDYAVGPLEGQSRLEWWMSIGAPAPQEPVDDDATVRSLPEGEDLWIWMAQNAHDVCGYYWLISRLKAYQGTVQVLYLNNLPFLTEKGNIFYPVYLHEIQPSEFRKARKLARPVTASEFEVDPDEWARITHENAGVRLLEGGKKIVGAPYGHYDADLLANTGAQWQKGSRVISNTLHRMKVKTGDVYLMWRLRELVASGAMQMNGDPAKGWNTVELKLPEPASTATP